MDYFPFNEGEQWGYIGREWDVLIPPIFEEADYFSDGLAAVLKNGLWGYIDMGGNVIIDYQFQSAERFVEGKAWVMAEEKFTLLNKKGTCSTSFQKVLRIISMVFPQTCIDLAEKISLVSLALTENCVSMLCMTKQVHSLMG